MIYDDRMKNNFPVFIVYNRLTVNLPFVRNTHQYSDPVIDGSSGSQEPFDFSKFLGFKELRISFRLIQKRRGERV